MVPRADDISYYYCIVIWSKNHKFWRSCSTDSMYNNLHIGISSSFYIILSGIRPNGFRSWHPLIGVSVMNLSRTGGGAITPLDHSTPMHPLIVIQLYATLKRVIVNSQYYCNKSCRWTFIFFATLRNSIILNNIFISNSTTSPPHKCRLSPIIHRPSNYLASKQCCTYTYLYII